MYAKMMGIYWFLVAGIRISRYLISENRRLSKPSMMFTQVIILDLLKQKFNVWIFILAAINCVRWSPSGDKLASSSDDKTVKLLDFKTGKVLYTGNTSDGCKLSISKYMIVIQKLYRPSLFSVLHLDKHETKRAQRTRITLKNVGRAAQFR